MKVKIFRSPQYGYIEKEINNWISENRIEIKFIKQSFDSKDNLIISVWFEPDHSSPYKDRK
ncbi:MAG: hypothetical protein HQ534_06665 [Armatimonadetes bacterium]|nr:hypothetical protein [Armatimonadota bacterium]